MKICIRNLERIECENEIGFFISSKAHFPYALFTALYHFHPFHVRELESTITSTTTVMLKEIVKKSRIANQEYDIVQSM